MSDDADDRVGLRNRTGMRLEIANPDERTLVLAPLELRTLARATRDEFVLTDLQLRGLVADEQPAVEERSLEGLGTLVWVGLLLLFGASFLIEDLYPGAVHWLWSIGLTGLGLVLAGAIWVLLKGADAARRQAAQFLALMLVILVGVGLPAGTIYVFGDVPQLLSDGPSTALFGRALQLGFIAVAALVPALLYFLFDRKQLSTQRQRFEQHVFRLDPDVRTLSDLQARYGKQVEEVFGTGGASRLARHTRWPILLATVVLTVGWLVALLPVGTPPELATPADTLALFRPQASLVAFGFLGAYYFALHTVLRRYVRADLQPKTYSTISTRVLVVVVLAWVLEAVAGEISPLLLLGAFVVGVLPETFFTFVQETVVRGGVIGGVVPRLRERHPLDRLDGIDLYDRARLMDEGVTNVEALAHHDLVDLLLETRIPAARLIDWVDQAILYLHVVTETQDDGADQRWRSHLRACGIRTATDLEAACRRAGGDDAALALLVRPADDEEPAAALWRLRFLLASLDRDEWLIHVRHWREHGQVATRVIRLDASGRWVDAPGAAGEPAAAGESAAAGKVVVPAAPHPAEVMLPAAPDPATTPERPAVTVTDLTLDAPHLEAER